MAAKTKEQLEADKKFDENYTRIFGETPPEERKGKFRFNETTKRLERVEEGNTNVSEAPHVFFKGMAWPNKKIVSERRHTINRQRNPLYTTLPEYIQQAENVLNSNPNKQ